MSEASEVVWEKNTGPSPIWATETSWIQRVVYFLEGMDPAEVPDLSDHMLVAARYGDHDALRRLVRLSQVRDRNKNRV